jgi:hypothetical protein
VAGLLTGPRPLCSGAVGLSVRLVLTVAVALVLAAPADAAFTSARLSVVNGSKRLGTGGPVTLSFAQAPADDATARIVTYVPRGYVTAFGARAGQVVGSGRATIERNTGRSAVTGELRAADPGRYQAQADVCIATPARLAAVFVLDLQEGGGSVLELPVFVRAVTSSDARGFASASLTFCLPPPGPPILEGRMRVLTLSLTFRGVFANPRAAGAYRWRSIWTPYREGVAASEGMVEAQALDLLPVQLTLVTGRFDRVARRVFVGGTLLANRRPVPGSSIQLLAGRTERSLRRLAVTRTNANGNYGGRLSVTAGTWYLRSRATVRGQTRSGCAVRTVPGVRCLRTTTTGFSYASRTLRLVVPPR